MRIAILNPSPSSPSRFATGTRAPSKTSSPVVEPVMPDLRLQPRHLETRRSRLDDECRDSVVSGVGVGLREHRVHARDTGVRDESLVAVDHVGVAVAPRSRPHRGRVGARFRPRSARTPRATRPTRASAGTRFLCSSEPTSLSPSDPSSCTARITPEVAHTFEISSIVISASSVPVPVPPSASSNRSPKSPCSR